MTYWLGWITLTIAGCAQLVCLVVPARDLKHPMAKTGIHCACALYLIATAIFWH